MAYGLPGYNATPINYVGKDGILFHLKDDMSSFLSLTATTDMKFSAPMEVSTQPVQTGQTVTDNIQEKPNTISINGVVVVGYEGAFLTRENVSVVEDFIATLQRWRSQRQILRVMCTDGITLDNAVCTNFEADKEKSIKNGLRISLTFQNANFVAQIGRTQTPDANSNSDNANGSKEGAKTKDGATTGKKDIGKSGSVAQPAKTPCQIAVARAGSGQETDPAVLRGATACGKVTGAGMGRTAAGIVYNEAEGAKYFPKNFPAAVGENVNKIPKT